MYSKKTLYVALVLAVTILGVLYMRNSPTNQEMVHLISAQRFIKRKPTVTDRTDVSSNTDMYFRNICTNRGISMPSSSFSQIRLDKFEDGKAEVTIQTYDGNNKSMSVGGDVILVWAEQVDGEGRSSGILRDIMDGSYTGHVSILWLGQTHIHANIASSAVNTCLRYNSLKRYDNVVYSLQVPWGINGVFKRDLLERTTRCGKTSYLYGYDNVCNFTTRNDGSPWYCGKPSNPQLQCRHIYSYQSGPFVVKGVKQDEKIHHYGHGTLKTTIFPKSKATVYQDVTIRCTDVSKRTTWTKDTPSGFRGKHWNLIHCRGPREHSHAAYIKCLSGKRLVFIGDSTVRQYFSYIAEHVMQLDVLDTDTKNTFGPNRTYHQNTMFTKYNITAYYRRHELPFHHPDARPNGVKSVPSLLKDIANGDHSNHSLVIVLNYFSHFLAFPTSHYRQRIHNLIRAIKYLQARKPRATIFFKSPHTYVDDPRYFDMNFALLYREIVFKELRDVMDNVIYLDTWDITVAYNNKRVHSKGRCLRSEVEQLMAYLCD